MRRFLTICLLIPAALAALSGPARAARDYAAALLMEAETGQVLWEREADRDWIPASLVKMMLLLLADEAVETGAVALADSVTATRRAQGQGGSQVFLAAGETATLRKLLEAVAVGSANDAAVAVAEGLYGTVESAVAAMNLEAIHLGMTGTHYVNVTGLPVRRGRPDNRSTARDQALLAREIVRHHPRVLEWTGLRWTRFRKGLVLGTTNGLMKEFEGMDGLKTGFHHRARCNLVATAERGGRRLIAVVLGSHSLRGRNGLAERLLERGYEEWELVEALPAGRVVADEHPVPHSWRASVRIESGAPLRFAIRPEDRGRVEVLLVENFAMEAPLAAGQELGRIEAILDGRVLDSVPAVAGHEVSRAWLPLPPRQRPPLRAPVIAAGMGG